jgi:hypothetical protein
MTGNKDLMLDMERYRDEDSRPWNGCKGVAWSQREAGSEQRLTDNLVGTVYSWRRFQ